MVLPQDIRIGDKCSVPIFGLLTRHYGVCVGHDARGMPRFVHNTRSLGYVTEASYEQFAEDLPVRIDQHAPPGFGGVIAARARALLGRSYNLVTFNCEHTANLAVNGRPVSHQVGVAWALVGVAVAALVGLLLGRTPAPRA